MHPGHTLPADRRAQIRQAGARSRDHLRHRSLRRAQGRTGLGRFHHALKSQRRPANRPSDRSARRLRRRTQLPDRTGGAVFPRPARTLVGGAAGRSRRNSPSPLQEHPLRRSANPAWGSSQASSVPIPKFANPCSARWCELRNQRDTSNSMILVPLLNPKFATIRAARCVRTSGSRHSCSGGIPAAFSPRSGMMVRRYWDRGGTISGDHLNTQTPLRFLTGLLAGGGLVVALTASPAGSVPLPKPRPETAPAKAGVTPRTPELAPQAATRPTRSAFAPSDLPSAADIAALKEAIAAARRGKTTQAADLQKTISDPVARKLVEWAILRS